MIQLATALPAISVGPVKPNAAISADASGFALALGALMPKIAAPSTGSPGQAGEVKLALPEGQELAGDGKELPDAVLGLDGKSEEQPGAEADSDDTSDAEDAPPPSFAWFTLAPPPAAEPDAKPETSDAAAAVTGEAGAKASPKILLPETVPAEPGPAKAPAARPAVPVMAAPEAKPQPLARPADAPVQAQPKAAIAPGPRAAPADPAPEAPVADARATPGVTSGDAPEPAIPTLLAPAPRELRQAAADAPVVRITLDRPAQPPQLSIADVTNSQREVSAAAVSAAPQVAAAFDLAPAPRAGSSSDTQAPDLSALAATTTGTQTAVAVTATDQGQDAALDTRHQQWTAQMLDKIEALRDAAPLRETRLSLMPEGLGKVDIAIRQDDAGLHVQFNTDTQAARQLIADAQPRLAEIAQERGIRLGSTSVESNAANTNGGTGAGNGAGNSQMNQGQRDGAAPNRPQPSAPASARREAQSSTQSDERVA